MAFAQDPMALVALAQEAVKQRDFSKLDTMYQRFMIMPYMHSESKQIHNDVLALFEALNDSNTLAFELRHKEIIDRFGRYPHRNVILQRDSTDEELLF